jgi:hypothetical protein
MNLEQDRQLLPDEKFFNNALATKIGVAVPRTVLLPSNQPPRDTNSLPCSSGPDEMKAVVDQIVAETYAGLYRRADNSD